MDQNLGHLMTSRKAGGEKIRDTLERRGEVLMVPRKGEEELSLSSAAQKKEGIPPTHLSRQLRGIYWQERKEVKRHPVTLPKGPEDLKH